MWISVEHTRDLPGHMIIPITMKTYLPRWAKNKTFLTKFFANNKSVESTDYETDLPNAASSEILIENTDKGSKA
jgi:hypothetical protein